MKKLTLLLVYSLFTVIAFAQQNADTLQQTGRDYMRKGDWGNAIMVFNRALQQKPNDLSLLNDIAYTYFLQRDFAKALETIKPVVESDGADVQSFQIAGTVYRAIEALKEGTKVYTKGLKKFPNSGVLYSEYGELLWQKKDYDAITQWEKGISVDPNYAGNYYNASRYYYFTTDKVWSLIYGEIFVNLESYTIRTAEIKNILYDGYKKLFADPDLLKNYNSKKKNEFEKAFLTSMNSQSPLAAAGIDPAKLIAIRTGFIKNWLETYAAKFPFRLFGYHKQLLEANMYEAYNQWIFGSAINAEQYQTWIKNNPEAYNAFNDFQRGRVFKLPKGQYYQNK
jgi:tetratricopeptide (TPR) repeat protein